MDIIRLLKQEHQKASVLLEEVIALGATVAKDTALQQLVLDLTVHERAEEEGVYSRLMALLPDLDMLEVAIQEQQGLKQLITAMEENLGGEMLPQQVATMRQMVMAHVQTEEEQLFPLIEKHVDEATRIELSQSYIHVKTQLLAASPHLNVTMVPESLVDQANEVK
jgi:hemerythrin superfamily protein